MTTQVAWLAPVCALIGICVAAYLGNWVLRQDPGSEKMNSISIKIQQGAKAFLMSEYKLLIIFMIVVAVVMAVALSPITALAFVTGGVLSAAAGYVGMHVATRANTRTAHAAEESVAKALNVSFKSGLTMGLCVASFALMGLSLWLIFLVFGAMAGVAPGELTADFMTLIHENVGMVEGFATGASAVALFARVGGGIYTKAADVGADLVGKVEAGIPEDDPRNPATIADNVGDNVGDVAGMGADLFESYTGSILAPTILAVTFGALGYFGAVGTVDATWAVVVPLMIAACGIITSIIGLFAVRTKEGSELHKALNRGTYVAAGIEIIAIFGLVSIHNGLLCVLIRVCFSRIIHRILFFRFAHVIFLTRSSSGILLLLRSISASHRIQIHIFQQLRRDPGHLCPVHTASHHHIKRSLHTVPAHLQSARQRDHFSCLTLRPSAHAADLLISVIFVVFQIFSP